MINYQTVRDTYGIEFYLTGPRPQKYLDWEHNHNKGLYHRKGAHIQAWRDTNSKSAMLLAAGSTPLEPDETAPTMLYYARIAQPRATAGNNQNNKMIKIRSKDQWETQILDTRFLCTT